MHLDALRSTHPIHAEIHNVAEAGEAFDLITYEKGGAVLRMIEGYLGEERFRDGIRLYMRRHAKANAVADDLWAALGESSREPVLELANAWIRQPGFPLVHVSRAGRTLRLEQRRFFSDPAQAREGDATVWPVPLVVRVGEGEAIREQRILLRDRRAEVTLAGEGEPAFVFANGGATGFYRVAYDASGLAALVRHLPRLATSERIALLSDEWALVRAGERDVGAFLDLVRGLRGRGGARGPRRARRAGSPRSSTGSSRRPTGRRCSASWRRSSPGSSPRPAGTPRRVSRTRRGCAGRPRCGRSGSSAGIPRVAREATARLDRWLAGDRAALEPNLHDAAVAMAARAGDAARFEAFRALFARETDPAFRRRYLLALAAFEDPGLADRGVDLALSGEVPLQDSASFVGAVLANRAAREPGWARIRSGWEALHARLAAAPMLLRRVVEAMGALIERRHLVEAEAFLAAHPLDEARQAIAQTLERLRQDVELRERTQEPIGRWLRSR